MRIQGIIEAAHDRKRAMQCFEHALAIAREQGARSWELRTATSIAVQHLESARPDAARDVLLPVLDSFTEGDGTADLTRAREVARELGHQG